jgi:hypothetical protein
MKLKCVLCAYLYSNHHIQMTLAVLLNDITHIIRFTCLLELSTRDKVFYLPYRSDCISVCFCQPAPN